MQICTWAAKFAFPVARPLVDHHQARAWDIVKSTFALVFKNDQRNRLMSDLADRILSPPVARARGLMPWEAISETRYGAATLSNMAVAIGFGFVEINLPE